MLKMGPTILFTHLKIILLQCFQFSVFSNNKLNPNGPIAIICTQVHWDFYHLAVSNPPLPPSHKKTHERYPQMLKSYGLLPPHSAYYVIRFLALINVSSYRRGLSCISNTAMDLLSSHVITSYSCVFKNTAIAFP